MCPSQVDGLYFVGAGTRPGNGVSGGLREILKTGDNRFGGWV